MKIDRFTQGKPDTVRKINEIVDAVNSLLHMTGDGFVNVQRSPTGTTLSLSMNELKTRFMNFGGGTQLRRAFVKTTPGATTTLVCFLDIDTTGQEVNVECTIYEGGNLDDAFPSFTDGDPLWVAFNAIDGEWQNVTRIDAVEDC